MAAGFGARKLFAVIAALFAVAALGHFLTHRQTELKAQGLAPTLPFSPASWSLPGLTALGRDPAAEERKPEDDLGASRLAQEIKEWRDDLPRARGERALEIHTMTYQGLASLAYHLEDVSLGLAPGDPRKAAQSLESARAMLIVHATQAARLAKAGREQAQARFHLAATRYQQGSGRSEAARELAELAGQGRLDLGTRRAAELLSALHRLDQGSDKERAKAEKTLKRLLPGLAPQPQVAVRLSLARRQAGLGPRGQKARKAQASYRSQLLAASAKAAALPPAEREAALRYSLLVWQGAEGSAIQWSKVPFRLNAYAGLMDVKAVIERAALADWQAGRRGPALRKYQGLSRSLAGSPRKADLDLRLLELRRADYVASRDPRPYEAALLGMAKAYLDPGLLGDGQDARVKAVASDIAARHRALVLTELSAAERAAASAGERRRAVSLTEHYLAALPEGQDLEAVKGKLAQVHALLGQHAEAVRLYRELAESKDVGQRRRYFALAVRSQSVLAAWPEQVPWQGFAQGPAEAREELVGLYRKLDETSSGPVEWFILAHIGLLDIALGREEAAFKAWTAALQKAPGGAQAGFAAGFMLTAYRQAKSWDELESLARLCMAGRVTPVYRQQSLNAVDLLALALLEGGKAALEAQRYQVAVQKLGEFVAKHPTARRHDEGFYHLAVAQRGATQHEAAIKTLVAFVQRYPRSAYFRAALLNGGDWSSQMAFEESTIYFHGRFLQSFAQDEQAPRLRQSLTELYLGRELYGEALALLRQSAASPDVDPAVKASLKGQAMDLEERQGSVGRAEALAAELSRDEMAPPPVRAEAFALLARHAAKAGRFAEVQRIEAQLGALGDDAETQEALGEARYLLAVAQDKTVIKRYFTLALRDPMTTLTQRQAAYAQARAAYQKVCHGGTSSFCAPAQHRLARLSERFLRSLDDIEIQETLAAEVVGRFRTRKQQIANDVVQTSENADARAVQVLGDGSTDPNWVEAVLWQNSAHWNIERVSGDAGHGYVQWTQGGQP